MVGAGAEEGVGAAALAVAEVVEDGGNGGRRWAGVGVWGRQDVSLLSLSLFLLYFCHASMMSLG